MRSGWVFYDGACGFCRSGVAKRRASYRQLGYQVLPIQHPVVLELLKMSPDTIPSEIHGFRRGDHQHLAGVDVVLDLLSRLGWGTALAALLRLPGIHQLASLAYAAVAARRKRGHCPLPSARP